MQIVIDIPEEIYKHIQEEQWLPNRLSIEKAIANGTPLPKGRGDIYDYNDLSKLVGEDFRVFLSRLDLNPPQPIIKAESEG